MSTRFKEMKVNRTFTFKLTDNEIKAYNKELGQTYRDLGAKEVEFSEVKRKFAKEIDELMERRDKIIMINDAGKEDRDVECTMKLDYESQTVDYIFDGKVMETRPMNEGERQTVMFTDQTKKKLNKTIIRKPAMNDDIRKAIHEETNKRTKKDMVI